jgi:hypothetical protein
MTTPAVSPTATSSVPATQAYRTRRSFAAIQFNEAGKGRFVFLSEGVRLRVIGPCGLSGCVAVMSERQVYSVFTVDLLARASPIFEPIRAKRRAMAACA